MRPHGKYVAVSATNPEAQAQCDRCSFWRNRGDLVFQTQWAGQHLYNVQVLVCRDRCFDTPNEQLRTIILPPDPPPIINARPPNFTYEENGPVQSTLAADVVQGAMSLPLVDATGFVVGMLIWVQLNNASFAKAQVTGVDLTSNVISVLSPLPFSAPYTGAVTADTNQDI